MEVYFSDLLCIGGGLAGERVAIEVASCGYKVIIVSLVPPKRSHSCAAQGGMQAALCNCAMSEGDSPEVHFEDTVRGADWGCDQEVVKMFVERAPEVVRELDFWGVPWNRVVPGKSVYVVAGKKFEKYEREEKAGLITARSFGGTSKWRTCYTSDGTGHSVMYAVDNKVIQMGIDVRDRKEAIRLVHDGKRCLGAVVRCLRTGELELFLARATVIATGGYGRLYPASTNAVINEGIGLAIALETEAVPLANMEAVQFHPTGTVPLNILVTEGCRGDGGVLLDKDLYRFMPDYEPVKAELASRDIVARAMEEHIKKGFGVKGPYGEHLWLDIRSLGKAHIVQNLKEVYDICINFLGIDPTEELIPVRPAQHYSMGGIKTTKYGHAYGLEGLFAVGEAACWDLHGFNRLGGNSLAETVVAGKIVGEEIVRFLKDSHVIINTKLAYEFLKQEKDHIERLKKRRKGEDVFEIKKKMQRILGDYVGIFRNEEGLNKAVKELRELFEKTKHICLRTEGIGPNPEVGLAIKIPKMVKLAICIAYSALLRKESRGAHYREDFPFRDDKNWLKRTLVWWKESEELPKVDYEPASRIYFLPPGDRGYGKKTSS